MRKVILSLCGLALVATSCRSSKGPSSYAPVRTQSAATFAAMTSKRVVRAAMQYPKKAAQPVQQLPMSLTGSDGTGLRLTRLGARAVVQGPLAFTELHLAFHNPEARVREGRFTITLPPGATVSRFAMRLNTGWQEAEMVERQAARQIYEDFLHRRQDPALLEKKAGNEFRARIFPIPANGIKEIKISYSHELADAAQPYRLHLRGLPKMDSLKITAFVGQQQVSKKAASSLGGVTVSHKVVKVDRQSFVPDRDFVVAQSSTLAGLRHGNLALVRVAPRLSASKAAMASVMMLVDTSASRAAGFQRQVEQLGAMVQHLKQTRGDKLRLHVACYDQQVATIFAGPVGQFGQRDLDQILARRPLGASDLHRALTWAGQQGKVQRLVLVTDGISTAGKTEGKDLRAAVSRLGAAAGVQRLDVVLVGGIRDEAGMRALVTGALERDGVMLDGQKPAGTLVARLNKQTVSGIKVSVPGARWIWPRTMDGVQPGDHQLVFADLPAGALAAGSALTVRLAGAVTQDHTVALATVNKPLLQRAWVKARMAHLERQSQSGALDPDMGDAIRKQIIKLSTAHRVLSDYTALLVLETEADYARYNIKRDALADILVVGQAGVEVMQRRAAPPIKTPPPLRRPEPDTTLTRGKGRDGQGMDDRVSGPGEGRKDSGAVATGRRAEAEQKQDRAEPRRKRQTLENKSVARITPSVVAKPRPVPRPPARQPGPAPAQPAATAAADEAPRGEAMRREAPSRPPRGDPEPEKKPKGPPALTGKLARVASLITGGKLEQALVEALRWRAQQPGDVMALVALGQALEAYGNTALAARVYGSIIDLFPSRADMRRFAGERLEALSGKAGKDLAADTYAKAVAQRPDHALGHRLHAFALVRQGKLEQALSALEAGLTQRYRVSRGGVLRILREDMGLVAAAMAAKNPNSRAALVQRLQKHGADIAAQPSLRFVLTWETDANDVDFHIRDGQGGHAYYSSKTLPSGGSLYADVTNGYGPECFTINGAARAFPYKLQIHYYSRGPMGYGMGKLQIVRHDGKGGLSLEDRPFVVMNDSAYVDLGVVKGDGRPQKTHLSSLPH